MLYTIIWVVLPGEINMNYKTSALVMIFRNIHLLHVQ